jgi:hypothetical protein
LALPGANFAAGKPVYWQPKRQPNIIAFLSPKPHTSCHVMSANWGESRRTRLLRCCLSEISTRQPALRGAGRPKKPKAEGPREGSKTALVVAMLQRKNGATLAEIMKTMGTSPSAPRTNSC